jgi:hypothetical protein
MGGMNSGSYYRWNAKTTTQSQHKIDIRFLKKQGWLVPNSSGSLSWTRNGEKSGSINYTVKENGLVISYRSRQQGDEWESIEETIPFSWTFCNYGGKRQWLHCPRCNRRVVVLYGGKYFRCRHCHNLTYSCQQQSAPFRLLDKAQNIRKKLGADIDTSSPISEKPKNMHWKTFNRLRQESYAASDQSWGIIGQRYGFYRM